jgi:hypothetical protein
MPTHDWGKVDAGIFHHFHQQWIVALTNVLNERLLPRSYYALAEQDGAGFELDVLTLKEAGPSGQTGEELTETGPPASSASEGEGTGAVLVAEPRVRVVAESDLEFYRRRQSVVAVRHASGDHLVAVVEIVSRGNRMGRKAFEDFVRKAAALLDHGVHLLVVDLQPPTARDPEGIHGAIRGEMTGEEYRRPADKPLTLAAYMASSVLRAYVEPVAVGDALIDMPLYLEPGRHVPLPLEETYQRAFASVPGRWRTLLEPA